jgi:glutamate--cysteine ligase
MRERKEGFFQFAWRMSLQHRDYFRQLTLAEPRRREFEEEAAASLQRQEVLEASDQVGFDQFLEDYFAQS